MAKDLGDESLPIYTDLQETYNISYEDKEAVIRQMFGKNPAYTQELHKFVTEHLQK